MRGEPGEQREALGEAVSNLRGAMDDEGTS
jgi:hypothetical protein